MTPQTRTKTWLKEAQDRFNSLEDSAGGRHGSLDGQRANVLPALLEKRDEVVDGQHDVSDKLLLSQTDVTDGDTHAKNLLELELDGGLDVDDLAVQVLSVRDGSGELASCGKVLDKKRKKKKKKGSQRERRR